MIGIDEVGRGCWAGPLLVIAARSEKELPPKLADSKVLSKKQREALFEPITQLCDIGEGWVEVDEIDTLGLSKAMFLGVERALNTLKAKKTDTIIMDGVVNYCATDYSDVQCVARADSIHPIVSAASIYAKVVRDSYMERISRLYPNYGFEMHSGYGTKVHANALVRYGITDIHRKSYKPIKALLS